jgi:hypothetical protein
VSALLAGVSFLAYATPPSVIFDSAGGSAAAAALAPQPAVAHKHKHEPTGEQVKHFLISARNVTYEVLFDVYGIGAYTLCTRGAGSTGWGRAHVCALNGAPSENP